MSWRHLRKLSDITDIRVVSVLLPSGDQLAVSFYVWTVWTLKDIQKDSKHLKTRLCWPSLHISCFSCFVAKIEMHFWRSKTLAKQQRCIAQVAPLEHPSWPVPCQDMSSRTQAPCWWLNIRKCWMKNAWTTYFNAIGGNQTRTELIVGKVKSHVNPANFANHFTKVFGSLVDFLVFSVSTESTGPLLVYPLVMCSRYWATQWPKHQVAAIRCCILEFGHSQGSKAIILINLLYAIFNTKPVYVPRYLCDLRVSIYKISNGGRKKRSCHAQNTWRFEVAGIHCGTSINSLVMRGNSTHCCPRVGCPYHKKHLATPVPIWCFLHNLRKTKQQISIQNLLLSNIALMVSRDYGASTHHQLVQWNRQPKKRGGGNKKTSWISK